MKFNFENIKILNLFVVYAFLFVKPLVAQAVIVRVLDRQGTELLQSRLELKEPTSVGQLTVLAFDQKKITYDGGVYGMRKIFDLENDIEVISDSEMKAYGWCFSLDGRVPETMADETPVANSESVIEWFYAFAHYKSGDWIGQCVRD